MKLKYPYNFSGCIHAAVIVCTAVITSAQTEPAIQGTLLEHLSGKSKPLPMREGEAPFKSIVQISPNGLHLAQTTMDRKIKYRRIKNDEVEKTFHACNPTALAFSNDGGILASVGMGKSFGITGRITVRIWGLEPQQPEIRFEIPGKVAEGVAIAQEHVIVASESKLHCYSISDKSPAWTAVKRAHICAIHFTNDGSDVVVSFDDGTLAVYDAQTGVEREIRK
jgi:WD40 repeat protein